MFNITDEVISAKLFGKQNEQNYPYNKFIKFLSTFNNKTISTLSGKAVYIQFSNTYGDWRLKTPTFDILVADCEFEKFCDCFPYNENIVYSDLKNILMIDKKFKNGKMSPKDLFACHIENSAFEMLDLFYGMVLNK